jgi:hypothetical protein
MPSVNRAVKNEFPHQKMILYLCVIPHRVWRKFLSVRSGNINSRWKHRENCLDVSLVNVVLNITLKAKINKCDSIKVKYYVPQWQKHS